MNCRIQHLNSPSENRTQSFIRTLNHFFKDNAAEDQRRRTKLAPPRRWNRNAGPPSGTASYMNYSSIKDEECRIIRIFVTIKFENHLFYPPTDFYRKRTFAYLRGAISFAEGRMSGSGSIGFRGAAKDITFSAEARKISRPDHRERSHSRRTAETDHSSYIKRSDQIIRSGEA